MSDFLENSTPSDNGASKGEDIIKNPSNSLPQPLSQLSSSSTPPHNNEDLHNVTSLTNHLAALWNEVATVFGAFHLALKKFRIEEDYGDEEQEVQVEGDSRRESTKAVMKFHHLGDSYLQEIINLQDIVRKKQDTIDRTAIQNHTIKNIDPDSDGVVGHVYPKWFLILKEKYENEALVGVDDLTADSSNTNTAVTKKKKLVFTLGKLAVFLGFHGMNRDTWKEVEIEALEELIDASKDFQTIFGQNNQPSGSPLRSPLNRDSCKYLGRRFFNFMRSVPELKGCIPDEEALEQMRYV
eukprot:scaffold4358_cov177-Ochromonas_danica.AAC.6